VREHPELLHHVIAPYDVGVGRPRRDRRLARAGEVLRLVLVRPLVPLAMPFMFRHSTSQRLVTR